MALQVLTSVARVKDPSHTFNQSDPDDTPPQPPGQTPGAPVKEQPDKPINASDAPVREPGPKPVKKYGLDN
jgi:hypothetical protein